MTFVWEFCNFLSKQQKTKWIIVLGVADNFKTAFGNNMVSKSLLASFWAANICGQVAAF
jgi:hypothetical protein